MCCPRSRARGSCSRRLWLRAGGLPQLRAVRPLARMEGCSPVLCSPRGSHRPQTECLKCGRCDCEQNLTFYLALMNLHLNSIVARSIALDSAVTWPYPVSECDGRWHPVWPACWHPVWRVPRWRALALLEWGGRRAACFVFHVYGSSPAPWDTSMCVPRPAERHLPHRPSSYWVPND